MKITHHLDQRVTATFPKGDDLARHAASAYSYVLNTSERRGIEHDGPAFAAAVEEVLGGGNVVTAEVIRHLKTI